MRRVLLTSAAIAALAVAIAAAFWPLWLQGRGLMAAMGAPGVTSRGPAGVAAAEAPPSVPVADVVAAYIDEPLAVYACQRRAAGDDVLWNPHNGLGVPLYGNWQSSIPSPLRWLVQGVGDAPWAFEVTYLLRLLLAGAGALLLARRLGLCRRGALATGIAFALCGYFVRYVQMHHLNAEVLLPWLWLAADALGCGPSAAAVLGLAFASFCVLVGGNPQPAMVAALATAGFAVARARTWGWRGVVRVGLTVLPGALFAAPYWLAGLEYVGEAVHHHSAAFGGDGYTAAGALGWFVPEPFGRPSGPPYYSEVAPYLGAVPLALALMGLGKGKGIRGNAFLLVALVLAGGKLARAPGTQWLGALPGLELAKLFKYLYPTVALALALLAGAGVAALARGEVSRARALVASIAVTALVAALTAAGLAATAESQFVVFQGGWGLARAGALLAALAVLPRCSRREWAALAALTLVAIELVAAAPAGWPPRRAPFAKPSFLTALRKEDEGSFRTLGAYGMWMPNQNAVFGIDDIRLHDGVFPRRYGAFVKRFLDPNVRHWPVFTADDLGTRRPEEISEGLRIANLLLPQAVAQDLQPSVTVDLFARDPARYLDLVNVRYLVLPGALAEAARARMPKSDCVEVFADEAAIVIERKTALPRAFFPRRVERVASMDDAFAKMAEPSFAPADVAYLEVAALEANAQPTASARVAARPAAAVLEVQAQATAPGWMVVSILPYPGLRAELQRSGGETEVEPLAIAPADGTLCAVPVPRGRFTVRFVYEATWRALGWWLRIAGAVLLLVFTLASRRPR